MEEKLITKKDLLGKLRAYSNTPDDENILYKRKSKRLYCQIHVFYMHLMKNH